MMVVLGVSSILPILPLLVDHFKTSEAGVGLVLTLFTLPGVLLAPVIGFLADRMGRKPVLVFALCVFGVFGTLCGFAPNFPALLALRFVQGTGAAALGVLNLTILGDMFEGKERTTYMGYNAAVLSVGTAAYPALGGLLSLLGWRFPFFLPALALPLAGAVAVKLKTPEPRSGQSVSAYLRGAWAHLKNPQLLLLLGMTFLTFVLLYGPFVTFLPLYMDQAFAAPPVMIGVIVSCASFLTALAASQLGRLSRKYSERQLVMFAAGTYALCFALIPAVPSLFWLIAPATLFGLGQGMNIPTVASLLAGYAQIQNRAAVMAVNGMLLRGGQTAGPLLMGGMFLLGGMKGVFASGVVLALLLMTLAGFLASPPKEKGPRSGA